MAGGGRREQKGEERKQIRSVEDPQPALWQEQQTLQPLKPRCLPTWAQTQNIWLPSGITASLYPCSRSCWLTAKPKVSKGSSGNSKLLSNNSLETLTNTSGVQKYFSKTLPVYLKQKEVPALKIPEENTIKRKHRQPGQFKTGRCRGTAKYTLLQ